MNETPKYSVIDIETTGGRAGEGRITEIAIYVMQGSEIVDEFASLVNPECFIPPYISRFTGITNDMVSHAPKFYEIARQIVEITDQTIFVAHNAPFDYNFVRKEFENLGFDYVRDVMCTVRLSRKIIPGYPSYSLGRLCESLNIPLSGRHRAGGDAHATALLLQYLMNKQGGYILPEEDFDAKSLHPDLDLKMVRSLPDSPGVYYFHNPDNEVIYIGKSRNIRKRVFSHLAAKGKRNLRIKEQFVDVSFNLTGSELVALLKESDEIKEQKPLFNRAGRRSRYYWGIYSFMDRGGYQRFYIDRIVAAESQPLDAFATRENALNALSNWVEQYDLCRQLSGLEDKKGSCFNYSVNQCKGACAGEENPSDYNRRVKDLIEKLNFSSSNFVIFDRGRHAGEKSFVWVERNAIRGYGWISGDSVISYPSQLEDYLYGGTDTRDNRQIIRGWLQKKGNSRVKILKY